MGGRGALVLAEVARGFWPGCFGGEIGTWPGKAAADGDEDGPGQAGHMAKKVIVGFAPPKNIRPKKVPSKRWPFPLGWVSLPKQPHKRVVFACMVSCFSLRILFQVGCFDKWTRKNTFLAILCF